MSKKYDSTLPGKEYYMISNDMIKELYMISNTKLSLIKFFQKIIMLFKLPGKVKENTYHAMSDKFHVVFIIQVIKLF